jgi:GYF domain 2
MKYFIQRGINEYGPYTLAELQRYVAQGNILLTDLTRSEGMTEWVPVSQVLGNIPPAAPAPMPQATGTVYSGPQATTAPYAGTQAYGTAAAPAAAGPVPPDFHWALVLLINFFCGLFRVIWQFVEAAFVKKIRPDSNFLPFLIAGKCLEFGSGVVFYAAIIATAAAGNREPPPAVFLLPPLGILAGIVVLYVGIFKMRAAIEEYYNTVEPINLRLSKVMTFFFPTFYFQHHFTRIARWKSTGYLEPQQ